MKKLMIYVVATVCAINLFTSCSKDAITPNIDSESEITTDLIGNSDLFGAVTDLQASARGGGGEDDFKPKKLKKVSVDSLSDVIKTYILTNYPNSTTKDAFKGKNNETVVIVKKEDGTLVGILFDANGAFVKEVKNEKGGKKDLTEVNITTLSTAITTYISTTYAGSSITKAATDTDGNFYVVIKKADGTLVGVKFDANGTFVKVLEPKGKGHFTEIDVNALLQTVKDYVNTNYPKATIAKAFNDKDGNIVVLIKTTDSKELAIVFDAKGNFLKIAKKK